MHQKVLTLSLLLSLVITTASAQTPVALTFTQHAVLQQTTGLAAPLNALIGRLSQQGLNPHNVDDAYQRGGLLRPTPIPRGNQPSGSAPKNSSSGVASLRR